MRGFETKRNQFKQLTYSKVKKIETSFGLWVDWKMAGEKQKIEDDICFDTISQRDFVVKKTRVLNAYLSFWILFTGIT